MMKLSFMGEEVSVYILHLHKYEYTHHERTFTQSPSPKSAWI